MKTDQKFTSTIQDAIYYLKESHFIIMAHGYKTNVKLRDGATYQGITAQGDEMQCTWAGQPGNGHWVDSESQDRVYPVYFK